MGWNGTGDVTRTHNFSADGSAGIKILASRMDTELNDFASAISNAVAKDGQNTPTANLPMAGFRHLNVGPATSAAQYLRVREYVSDVPIFVSATTALSHVIVASVDFYTSVSAGQSPPDGARLRFRASQPINVYSSAQVWLFTPTNPSAGGQPHVAPIYSRADVYNPGDIQANQLYELAYDAVVSAWRLMNPARGYHNQLSATAKVIDANGLKVGQDGDPHVVFATRNGAYLHYDFDSSVSVSCSASGRYIVLSANGISALTDDVTLNLGMTVPVMVKDTLSMAWKAQVGAAPGIGYRQLWLERTFNVDGTTVSANCTIKISPTHLTLMIQ